MSDIHTGAFYRDDYVTVYLGDCLKVLGGLGAVDHLIADPPYSAEVHENAVHTPAQRHADNVKHPRRDLGFGPAVAGCEGRFYDRLPTINRWHLIFSDVERVGAWREDAEGHGYRYVRTMFWHKLNAQPQITGDRPAAHVEAILLGHNDKRMKWNGGGHGNVFSFPIAKGASERFDHGTPKPLALMKRLVSLFTDEGDLVLDPFGGTGTTARACKDLKRRCIIIEKDKRWCEVIAERLRQEVLL